MYDLIVDFNRFITHLLQNYLLQNGSLQFNLNTISCPPFLLLLHSYWILFSFPTFFPSFLSFFLSFFLSSLCYITTLSHTELNRTLLTYRHRSHWCGQSTGLPHSIFAGRIGLRSTHSTVRTYVQWVKIVCHAFNLYSLMIFTTHLSHSVYFLLFSRTATVTSSRLLLHIGFRPSSLPPLSSIHFTLTLIIC